ncbi:hypothetical protein EV143_11175 [Flavobacterium chryseum]|nr:hypothetical protein EV143_11175 [Flavobacterium sp. P3160]
MIKSQYVLDNMWKNPFGAIEIIGVFVKFQTK